MTILVLVDDGQNWTAMINRREDCNLSPHIQTRTVVGSGVPWGICKHSRKATGSNPRLPNCSEKETLPATASNGIFATTTTREVKPA
jgi:hypothetical protein